VPRGNPGKKLTSGRVTMNHADLITRIHQRTGWPKKQIHAATNEVFETIYGELAKGHSVSIHNFGTFKLNCRVPRLDCSRHYWERIGEEKDNRRHFPVISFSPSELAERNMAIDNPVLSPEWPFYGSQGESKHMSPGSGLPPEGGAQLSSMLR
jgi:nucleoid DNA-binding protein